jgi:hypothetical protein
MHGTGIKIEGIILFYNLFVEIILLWYIILKNDILYCLQPQVLQLQNKSRGFKFVFYISK